MKKVSLFLCVMMLMLFLCGCQDRYMAKKPVIYLYPEETTDVEVKLDYEGELSHCQR